MKHIEQYIKALTLATKLHNVTKDSSGMPYIDHAIRVALNLKGWSLKCAALLHDVIEDCGVTAEYLLKEGVDPIVIEAVEHLTHKDGEDYEIYVQRCCNNLIARAVKRADIIDNSDESRPVSVKFRARLRLKYAKALNIIDKYEENLTNNKEL